MYTNRDNSVEKIVLFQGPSKCLFPLTAPTNFCLEYKEFSHNIIWYAHPNSYLLNEIDI